MIKLVSNENHDNYLGLLPTDQQRQAWFQIGSFKPGEKIWACEAPNLRIKALREAYLALSKLKTAGANNQEIALNDGIDTLLRAISSNGDSLQAMNNFNSAEAGNIQHLLRVANVDFARVFVSPMIVNTNTSISSNGFAYVGAGKNADLVEIINIFNKLYKSDGSNPLPKIYNDFAEKLNREAAPQAREDAINGYLKALSDEINLLMKMSRAEFDMAFDVDNKKQPAITRLLKKHFNRLALECDYDYHYINVGKEQAQTSLKQSRVIWNHIWRSRANFFRNQSDYQLLNANAITGDASLNDIAPLKADDGSDIPYQLKPIGVNEYASQQRGKKQRTSKAMQVVIPVALVFAGIVAFGQMAIATASLAGFTAALTGAAAFTANFFLIGRDTKGMFKDGLKGKLTKLIFEDLTIIGSGLLVSFGALSFVTGLVSGGFVFRALADKVLPNLLPKIYLASLATPAGIAAVAGITAVVSVVGMTALYFMVGVGTAETYKGRYLRDKKIILANGTTKDIPGVFSDWKEAAKQFWNYPTDGNGDIMYNSHVTNLLKQLDAAKAVNAPSKIKRLASQLSIAKWAFKARHNLKLVFAVFLVPIAVVASAIYTAAIMKSSFDGTKRLLQMSFHMADIAALAITWQLTVGASVVNGALNGKNMFFAAEVFSAKLGQLSANIASVVANTALAVRHPSRAIIAFHEAKDAFEENPSKTIWPAMTAFSQAFIICLLVLNGRGNATELANEGTIHGSDMGNLLPDTSGWFHTDGHTVTYLASLFGSIALNYMASIVDTFKKWTPYRSVMSNSNSKGPEKYSENPELAHHITIPAPTVSARDYVALNKRMNSNGLTDGRSLLDVVREESKETIKIEPLLNADSYKYTSIFNREAEQQTMRTGSAAPLATGESALIEKIVESMN